MKRSIYLHLMLVLLCVFAACNKENEVGPLNPSTGEPAETVPSPFRDPDLSQVDMPPTYKGLYIDNTQLIIGNTIAENNLITYAVNKGINAFSFYGLKDLIKLSSNYSKVRNFLNRCTQNGIIYRVNVVVYYPGSVNTSDSTYVRKYNESCTSSSQKLTGVQLEWEWWNGATTWSTYKTTMLSYYNWTRTQSPDLTNEIYFGWFKNPTTIPLTMATEMVKYCDRILVHDYRPAPDHAYMQSRLGYLGQAAQSKGKTQKIVVLFSAEANFMGPYYTTHNFHAAYVDLTTQFTNASFTGKSGLRYIGWQVYHYSHAKQFRP